MLNQRNVLVSTAEGCTDKSVESNLVSSKTYTDKKSKQKKVDRICTEYEVEQLYNNG